MKNVSAAEVRLWGALVGTLYYDPEQASARSMNFLRKIPLITIQCKGLFVSLFL
jgi:hypothetical protein